MKLIMISNRAASMMLCWMFITPGGLTEVSASPVRGPFPADITIRDDAEVLLRFPYEVLLADEWISGYMAIRNLSDEPLTIQKSPIYYTDDQIIYESRSSSDSPVVSDAPYWPNWELMTSRNPLKHLEKNEYVLYDIDRIGYTVQIVPMDPGDRAAHEVLEDLKVELERARDLDSATTEPDPVAAPPSEKVQPEPETAEEHVSPASSSQSPKDRPSDPVAEPSSEGRILLLLLLAIVGETALFLDRKRKR